MISELGSVTTIDPFRKQYLVTLMAKKEAPSRTPAKPRRSTPPPIAEPVAVVLDRLARNPSWSGELSAEQAKGLQGVTTSDDERVLVALFSKGSTWSQVDQGRLTDMVRLGELITPAIRKRIGPRLVHHGYWDALLDVATVVGVKKLTAELAAVPSEAKSAFSAKYLTVNELSTDDAAKSRRLKRDLSPIAAWALNRDADLVAKALLTLSLREVSGSRVSIAKEALIALVLHLPEDASVCAINSSAASSLELAQLARKLASTKHGVRNLQSLLVLIAKSRRTDVLANGDCWNDLSLLEIGQLLKTPEIVSHLAAQPAWWTARQRRELSNEGIGAVLRLIDCHRHGGEIVDKDLLGTYLRDLKRAANSVIREAFSAVVDSALEAQAVVHQLDIEKRRQNEKTLESSIATIKAEQEATLHQLERLEGDLRRQEREEIQSRREKDLAAQQPLLESIVALVIALERMRQNTPNNEQIIAYVNEIEAILMRVSIRVARDANDDLVEVVSGETVLYRRK